MNYQRCECRYCDNMEDETGGYFFEDGCPNEGTIKVPGYGWLCPQCYDEIDTALKTIDHDDLTVLDPDGNVLVQCLLEDSNL